MKDEPLRLARRYTAALRKHLMGGTHASLEPALKLGRQSVATGLETLDLAKIHEQALTGLLQKNGLPKTPAIMTNRAGIFFKEASVPIEETHRTAAQAKVHMNKLTETLGHRTAELADASRRLQQGVAQRKVMEDAYEKRRKLHNICLEESLQLQKRLRQLTHRLLAGQENERKKISRELQDEIAQTLIGINVRLLSLKQQARGNTKRIKNEIANTQRLVVKSAGSVRRVAQKLGTHEPQAPSLVTTLSGSVADSLKAGQARKNGVGARTGQASSRRRAANAGSGEDS